MKKGMVVTLDNGLEFNLVDSVNFNNEKYFAATSTNKEDESLYFFKLKDSDGKESLEFLEYEGNEKVIDALLTHIENTFE